MLMPTKDHVNPNFAKDLYDIVSIFQLKKMNLRWLFIWQTYMMMHQGDLKACSVVKICRQIRYLSLLQRSFYIAQIVALYLTNLSFT